MASRSVYDWKIKVGWDASAVEAGHKRIDRLMERTTRVAQTREDRVAKKRESAQRQEAALQNKRIQAERAVFGLKKAGLDEKELRLLQNRLNATKTAVGYNKIIIASREAALSLEKRTHEQIRRNTTARRQEAAAAAASKKVTGPTVMGAYSRIQSVSAGTLDKKMAGIEQLDFRARESLTRLPQGQAFEAQRRAIQGVIDKLANLRTAYRQAGTTTAFNNLAGSFSRLTSEVGRYESASKRAESAMKQGSFAANRLSSSVRNLAGSYLSIFAALEGGRRFMETGIEFESFDAMMLGVSGTAQEAAKDFGFVSQQVLRLGGDLREGTRAFAKFGTAGVLSDISREKVKEMYTQISEVNRAFALAPQRQGLTFLAFEQMLG